MPTILSHLDKLDFVVSKPFIYEAKKYEVGDEAPEAKDWQNLEVLVRNRYLMPVVDTTDDLPLQFRHTVRTRELAYTKIGRDMPKKRQTRKAKSNG